MTPKQALWAHISADHRRQPSKHSTLVQLQRWHSNEHHRYVCGHYHEGVNLGPGQRPRGWYTGEDVRVRD